MTFPSSHFHKFFCIARNKHTHRRKEEKKELSDDSASPISNFLNDTFKLDQKNDNFKLLINYYFFWKKNVRLKCH